jgi:hypothetical protein
MADSSRSVYAMGVSAYCTAVLHAAGHASSAVHGILTGLPAVSGRVEIVGALPVAHSALACRTSLATETALLLAAEYARVHGLTLVGSYYAPEVADDNSQIPIVVTRMADALARECPDACILVMDAARLAPEERKRRHCFRLHLRSMTVDASWDKAVHDSDADLVVTKEALERCDHGLAAPSGTDAVSDFEAHCLDPSRDWLSNGRVS